MCAYNPGIHHRRSIRLKGYNYSRAGMYFITLCTQQKQCLFGDIQDDAMCLNSEGTMIQAAWNDIPQFYPSFGIDVFVLMPNHIHGIIVIDKTDTSGSNMSLSDVVHRFKTLTTKRYSDGVKQNGWPSFPGRLWQRNYWERIIRDDKELNGIREYIQYNPKNWQTDELFTP